MGIQIGIIGGRGKFGQWLNNFFQGLGYVTLVSDLGTKVTNQEVVEKSEVVVFSVPLGKTIKIIEEVVPYSREGTLWTDVASLKAEPVRAMLKSLAEVIGMHPMFSPSLPSMRGQTIVLCPARADHWLPWWYSILENNGAKVKITDPETHDQMMAIIQGGTHIPLIAAGYAFKKLGVEIEESLEFTSPIYKLRLAMMGRVLGGDPRLYAEIAILNPATLRTVSSLLTATQHLFDIVISKDVEEFIRFFKETAEFFGDFKTQAINETNYLIQKMAERESTT